MRDLWRRRREEGGYAVIMTALLLVPLMGFAGFAVDVGAWYSRASELQRAADAAALAGVVWQPDFSAAETAARAEAARNGFTHGVDGIEVNVTNASNNQLQVQIIDTDADMFFAGIFLDEVAIGRQAVSEYIDAVPLGSPKNHFGTNNLVTGSPENFSAAINGSCTPREQGDHRSVHFMNNWTTPGYYADMLCPTAGGGPGPDTGGIGGNTGWNDNPYYEGFYSYTYYLNVPDGNAAPIDLFLRDPNFNTGGPLDTGSGTSAITTTFRVRAPDSTRFDDSDNPTFTGCTAGRAGAAGSFSYPSGASTGTTSLFSGDGSTWDLFCRIPADSGGRYLIEVGTANFEANSFGSNNYALLAHNTAGGYTCDSRTDGSCPSLVARDWMSIYAALAGSAADFFLAEIGDEHEGKSMKITLFDPGEGSDYLQILNPDGTAVSFTWETTDGVYSGSGTSLTVSGGCGANCPTGNASSSQFSDRFVEITVPLPTDFAAAYTTTDRWWRIYYNTGAAPTDRTSWSVEILGDPVRLLE